MSSDSTSALHTARQTSMIAGEALDHLLVSLHDVVRDLDDRLYGSSECEVLRSSPGGHLRHLLDHIRTLFAALEGAGENPAVPLVAYDRRERGTALERDRHLCLHELEQLRERLARIQAAINADELAANLPLQIEQIVQPAVPPLYLESNLARELVFVFHHAIHHAALLAARLRQAGLELSADFGVAPATLAAGSHLKSF